MAMRPIDIEPFDAFAASIPLGDPGPAPQLQWIAIGDLVVDPQYQRDIGRRGVTNVIAIARAFDWSKFSTVVVAPIEGGRYAIVDGQHRTTAAALRGIKKVPCQVVIADRARQAEVFAAINTATTAMTALQIHAAKVTSGDPAAARLAAVCEAADVTICRYPVPLAKLAPGQALCLNLEADPDWRADEPRLLRAMQRLDLAATYTRAAAKAAGGGGSLAGLLMAEIGDHLEKHFAALPETEAV